MTTKIRLDSEIVSRGLAESREKAKAYIMSGSVYVNNQKACKAGDIVKAEDIIEVRGNVLPFVSRGGLKLDKAIKVFDIKLDGLTCVDIGASTGGFTDCMLQCGAKKIYSVDVGYGQLAWKLRCDQRVVNLERTNFRHITANEIPDVIDFASADASFISLSLLLPPLFPLMKMGGRAVCLIKPQFEAGKDKVGKKGVVKDPAVHYEVLQKAAQFIQNSGFSLIALDFSPIKGPEGNIEFLAYIEKSENPQIYNTIDFNAVIEAAHSGLKENI